MENRIVADFLHNIQKYNKITILEKYVDLLIKENSKINLISRKTTVSEIWIKHIYDSIQPAKFYDFSNLIVLDFGTGGGLPGLPIKILFPSAKLYFLDSVKKKIRSLKEIVINLSLENCFFIDKRLEEINFTKKFDIILSRSVKIDEKYLKILRKFLKESGKIILYKTENIEPIVKQNASKIIDVSNEYLISRKLVEIDKK